MNPVLGGVLSGIVLVGIILYAFFAGFWRSDAAGHQRIKFKELKALMNVAPENWKPDICGSEYIIYKPTGECIYMHSYFDTLRLSRLIKKVRKHKAVQVYAQNRADLLQHFQKDVASYKQKLNDTLQEMQQDACSTACKYCSDKWGCDNDASLPARKCPYRKYKTSKCTKGKSMMLWDRIKITFY